MVSKSMNCSSYSNGGPEHRAANTNSVKHRQSFLYFPNRNQTAELESKALRKYSGRTVVDKRLFLTQLKLSDQRIGGRVSDHLTVEPVFSFIFAQVLSGHF